MPPDSSPKPRSGGSVAYLLEYLSWSTSLPGVHFYESNLLKTILLRQNKTDNSVRKRQKKEQEKKCSAEHQNCRKVTKLEDESNCVSSPRASRCLERETSSGSPTFEWHPPTHAANTPNQMTISFQCYYARERGFPPQIHSTYCD